MKEQITRWKRCLLLVSRHSNSTRVALSPPQDRSRQILACTGLGHQLPFVFLMIWAYIADGPPGAKAHYSAHLGPTLTTARLKVGSIQV